MPQRPNRQARSGATSERREIVAPRNGLRPFRLYGPALRECAAASPPRVGGAGARLHHVAESRETFRAKGYARSVASSSTSTCHGNVRNVASVAIVPIVRFTVITTIFAPTLKLSTSDAGAVPENM